ncbi:hypothetical protein [Legionella sp. km772]|uniref:hypothetical protein n=1 Tax=Legionella sp. km772 TaxID=2498111 RepID=UPI000F8D00DE|nr:hypothetical protein [Legionella sp. km772]RUR07225.1 hypothetical protein ELY15_12370 [Legionella sp. km772]
MNIDLALKEGTRFVVNLSLDLKSYCDAYLTSQLYQKRLVELKEAHAVDAGKVSAAEMVAAESDRDRANEHFAKLREDYVMSLKYLSGEMHWDRIKTLIKNQCTLTNLSEQRLFAALSGEENVALPLVIECLNTNFIELLKNSIDTILINRLKKASANTLLQMEIALLPSDKDLAVQIKDNAGGFSQEYLDDFSNIIKFNDPRLGRAKDTQGKHEIEGYCFGGSGLGHLMLANFILRGQVVDRRDKYRAVYNIEEGATTFSIANNAETRGAEIILKSPMRPFALLAGEKPLELAFTLKLPSKKKNLGFFPSAAPAPLPGLSSSDEPRAEENEAISSLNGKRRREKELKAPESSTKRPTI